jgi:hypothetical protein
VPGFSYSRGGRGVVDIEGLTDFIQDCKHIDGNLDKAVTARGREFGKRVVARARAKASSDSQRAKAARTLRVSSSARGVLVSGGGARARFFWGAEFGSKRMTMGRKLPGGLARAEKKKWGGFERWTGNQYTDAGWGRAPGYFLNPAVNEVSVSEWDRYKEDIEGLYSRAFDE